MAGGILSYASQIASCAVSVWFISWAIRRRYELDHNLTRIEQFIRWMIVLVAFGLTFLSGSNFAMTRIIAGITGMLFVAWPNLAHRVLAIIGRFHSPKQYQ